MYFFAKMGIIKIVFSSLCHKNTTICDNFLVGKGEEDVKTYRICLSNVAVCCRKRETIGRGSAVRSINDGNWLRGSTAKAFSGGEAITRGSINHD
jgi:hypothetical protein